MDLCFTGIAIPPLENSPCEGGIYYSTDCVTTPSALVYLGIAEGATQTAINAAIVTFLIGKDAQIADLQAQINTLEDRIEALENPIVI